MTDELDLAPIKQRFWDREETITSGTGQDYERATTDCARDVPHLIAEVERLRAIGPGAWTHAVVAHMDRADKAEAAVARVRALAEAVNRHKWISIDHAHDAGGLPICLDPDAVLRALDGETGEQ